MFQLYFKKDDRLSSGEGVFPTSRPVYTSAV